MKSLPRLSAAVLPFALFIASLFAQNLFAQELQCRPCWHGFGQVQVGSSRNFSIELRNSGDRQLRIKSDSVEGSAFTIGEFHLPITLEPGASVELPVIFTPTAQGHTHGIITLDSTAPDSRLTLNVGGDGVEENSHSVYLSWQGNGQAVGYNIYRGTVDGGPYTRLNSSLDSVSNYTDYTVQAGETYYYVATEVDAEGVESNYSNIAEAVIPN